MEYEDDPFVNAHGSNKIRRLNPVGENMYLNKDGTITKDEDKIVAVQRIFKDNYYKPGGKGSVKVLAKYL